MKTKSRLSRAWDALFGDEPESQPESQLKSHLAAAQAPLEQKLKVTTLEPEDRNSSGGQWLYRNTKTSRSQEAQVLVHLNTHGSITSWEAIKKYGITRLAARIFTIRKRLDYTNADREIKTHMMASVDGKYYAKYVLIAKAKR